MIFFIFSLLWPMSPSPILLQIYDSTINFAIICRFYDPLEKGLRFPQCGWSRKRQSPKKVVFYFLAHTYLHPFPGKYLQRMGYAPIIGYSDRLEIFMSAGQLRKTGIRWVNGIRPFRTAARANGRGHEKKGALT
jgi:hypothetical protein